MNVNYCIQRTYVRMYVSYFNSDNVGEGCGQVVE